MLSRHALFSPSLIHKARDFSVLDLFLVQGQVWVDSNKRWSNLQHVNEYHQATWVQTRYFITVSLFFFLPFFLTVRLFLSLLDIDALEKHLCQYRIPPIECIQHVCSCQTIREMNKIYININCVWCSFFLQLNSCNKGGNKRDPSVCMPTLYNKTLYLMLHIIDYYDFNGCWFVKSSWRNRGFN